MCYAGSERIIVYLDRTQWACARVDDFGKVGATRQYFRILGSIKRTFSRHRTREE